MEPIICFTPSPQPNLQEPMLSPDLQLGSLATRWSPAEPRRLESLDLTSSLLQSSSNGTIETSSSLQHQPSSDRDHLLSSTSTRNQRLDFRPLPPSRTTRVRLRVPQTSRRATHHIRYHSKRIRHLPRQALEHTPRQNMAQPNVLAPTDPGMELRNTASNVNANHRGPCPHPNATRGRTTRNARSRQNNRSRYRSRSYDSNFSRSSTSRSSTGSDSSFSLDSSDSSTDSSISSVDTDSSLSVNIAPDQSNGQGSTNTNYSTNSTITTTNTIRRRQSTAPSDTISQSRSQRSPIRMEIAFAPETALRSSENSISSSRRPFPIRGAQILPSIVRDSSREDRPKRRGKAKKERTQSTRPNAKNKKPTAKGNKKPAAKNKKKSTAKKVDQATLKLAEHALKAIECPVCLSHYKEEQDQIPCTLPCGHSLCLAHLAQLQDCPICRARIPHSEKINKSVALCDAAKAILAMTSALNENARKN